MRSLPLFIVVACEAAPEATNPVAPPAAAGVGWPEDVPILDDARGAATHLEADAVVVEATTAATADELVGWYDDHLTARWKRAPAGRALRRWVSDDWDELALTAWETRESTGFQLQLYPAPPSAPGEVRAHGRLPSGWPAELGDLRPGRTARLDGGRTLVVDIADATWEPAGWALVEPGVWTDGPRTLRAVATDSGQRLTLTVSPP